MDKKRGKRWKVISLHRGHIVDEIVTQDEEGKPLETTEAADAYAERLIDGRNQAEAERRGTGFLYWELKRVVLVG